MTLALFIVSQKRGLDDLSNNLIVATANNTQNGIDEILFCSQHDECSAKNLRRSAGSMPLTLFPVNPRSPATIEAAFKYAKSKGEQIKFIFTEANYIDDIIGGLQQSKDIMTKDAPVVLIQNANRKQSKPSRIHELNHYNVRPITVFMNTHFAQSSHFGANIIPSVSAKDIARYTNEILHAMRNPSAKGPLFLSKKDTENNRVPSIPIGNSMVFVGR